MSPAMAPNDTPSMENHDNTAAGPGTTEAKPSAQDLGWVMPTPINYEQAQSREPVQAFFASEAKYEYSGDVGEVGPRVPQLEESLFNGRFRVQAGDKLNHLMDFNVYVEGEQRVVPIKSFEQAGLHPVMLDIIKLVGYQSPTPIQQYTIPAVTSGVDMIAVAQTGSGKTAAYLIPVISRLMGKAKKLCAPRPNPSTYNPQVDAIRAEPIVLIICPTRELAMQIFDETRRFCYRSMLRPAVCYGGAPRREQLEDLKRGCDVLIGTPGRLKDFVENESRWLSLARLKYTILDEADEILQPDWEEQMKSLLGGAGANQSSDHLYLMFSATFNRESRQMARKFLMNDHLKIKVGRVGSVHKNVIQDVVWVNEDMKMQAMYDLLTSMPPCRTLIFCNNNGKADTIDDFLYNEKFPVTSIHSGRTQFEREDAIRAFRTGKCPIMVTSNVSARGLDVKNVMHIINYDMPSTQHGGIQEYVHRIGRTARIGNQGQATSFFNDRNEDIGPALTNVLLDTSQTIPDFLQQHVDESGVAVFEDDKSDDEGQDGDANVGSGWGAAADDGWGPPAASKAGPASSFTAQAKGAQADVEEEW